MLRDCTLLHVQAFCRRHGSQEHSRSCAEIPTVNAFIGCGSAPVAVPAHGIGMGLRKRLNEYGHEGSAHL